MTQASRRRLTTATGARPPNPVRGRAPAGRTTPGHSDTRPKTPPGQINSTGAGVTPGVQETPDHSDGRHAPKSRARAWSRRTMKSTLAELRRPVQGTPAAPRRTGAPACNAKPPMQVTPVTRTRGAGRSGRRLPSRGQRHLGRTGPQESPKGPQEDPRAIPRVGVTPEGQGPPGHSGGPGGKGVGMGVIPEGKGAPRPQRPMSTRGVGTWLPPEGVLDPAATMRRPTMAGMCVNVYTYIYMHVCMYVCMYVCMTVAFGSRLHTPAPRGRGGLGHYAAAVTARGCTRG